MTLLRWLWLRYRANAQQLEQGQSLVEYALILVLASIVVVILVFVLGHGVGDLYQTIVEQLPFWG
jgi:Flp pilus assembly pilin Flp